MNMGLATTSPMTAYWDDAHQNRIRGALSGHPLSAHVQFLRFNLAPAGHALCIGVGMGDWIRDLAGHHWGVSSLDISPEGLKRVADLGDTYLPGDPLPKDTFDLAISHWVSPHMMPADFAAQLANVVPALKKYGAFAVHYNEPLDRPKRQMPDDPIARTKFLGGGGVEYSREEFVRMVEQAGGRIVKCAQEMPSPQFGKLLVGMHVGRNDR